MLFQCRATHVLWVIWDAEFDGSIDFKFDHRKDKVQVKLGKIRSNSKIQKKILQKYDYLVQFFLRIPKMSYIFV